MTKSIHKCVIINLRDHIESIQCAYEHVIAKKGKSKKAVSAVGVGGSWRGDTAGRNVWGRTFTRHLGASNRAMKK